MLHCVDSSFCFSHVADTPVCHGAAGWIGQNQEIYTLAMKVLLIFFVYEGLTKLAILWSRRRATRTLQADGSEKLGGK